MLINAAYTRKIKSGSIQNTTKAVEVGNLNWDTQQIAIHSILVENKPEGRGWRVSGYAPAKGAVE